MLEANASSTSSFVIYFNGDDDGVDFTLPSDEYAPAWDVVVDTGAELVDSSVQAEAVLAVRSRSVLVLARAHPGAARTGWFSRPRRRSPAIRGGLMRIPTSTYRLQIRAAFELDGCRRRARLRETPRRRLGLPLTAAQRGGRFRPRLRRRRPRGSTRPAAGNAASSRSPQRAHRLGLGVLVDIVPNHVGVAGPAANPGGGTC